MGAFGLGTIHLGDGGEAKGGSVAKTLIPGSRRRLVRGDPRHRHATAIAALFIITLGGEVRSWVLKTIPRNMKRKLVHIKAGLIIGVIAALTTPFGTWVAGAVSPRAGAIMFAAYLCVLLVRSFFVAVKATRAARGSRA